MSIYKKTRLDQLLVDSGLAATRSRAADLVRRGAVSVEGAKALKPGTLVRRDAVLVVDRFASSHVSRGGLKLAAALDAFGFSPDGRVALDLGASTGGFTDVQPDFSINSRILVTASLRFAGSRTIPPLPTPSRPASNCGLTSATSQAPGAARLKATGSTRIRLMKLTSATIA